MTASFLTRDDTRRDDPWEGFAAGEWQDKIDVRDFILANYTPYTGDASFLEGPTAKTLNVWDTLQREFLSVERAKRVYDVETHIPADVDAFPAGYICEDDDVIVGLQTDVPLKRPMMPNGGWRMVETAIREAGLEPTRSCRQSQPETHHRKRHRLRIRLHRPIRIQTEIRQRTEVHPGHGVNETGYGQSGWNGGGHLGAHAAGLGAFFGQQQAACLAQRGEHGLHVERRG